MSAAAMPVTTPIARELASLGDADLPVYGPKAVRLGQMAAAGLPVPPGVVLGAAQDARVAACQLREHGRLAVRSSALDEDLEHSSAAGRYLSVLDVAHEAGLERAVLDCRASAHGAPIGVIVQRLVSARAAGVAFTADPVTGERDVVVVDAVAGLGDALMAGEVTPERWRVTQAGAAPVGSATVLEAGTVERVAELARQTVDLFGGPQDVEWAQDDQGDVFLVQSRPITALPAAPVPIDESIPAGTWIRDDHHTVITPALFDFFFASYDQGFGDAFQRWGVPALGKETRLIRGHLYGRIIMPGPADKPPPPTPPKWLMRLMIPLIPSLRRMARAAKAGLAGEAYARVLEEWNDSGRAQMEAEADTLAAVDVPSLAVEGLTEHIDAVKALGHRGALCHASIAVPYIIALSRFAALVEDALGWTDADVMAFLATASPVSSEPTRALQELAQAFAANPPTCLESPAGRGTYARLAVEAPELAQAFDAWLDRFGCRVLDYDLDSPTLQEEPELALQLLREAMQNSREGRSSSHEQRDAMLADARQRLSTDLLDRFDRYREHAEFAYGMRDDNGIAAVAVPTALARRVFLEAGRRLGLAQPRFAFFLTFYELKRALRGQRAELDTLIQRRRGEASWARQNPGPVFYGAPPPPPPPWQRFPGALGEIVRGLAFLERAMPMMSVPASNGAIEGTGSGPGRYTGVARIVQDVADLRRVGRGEILVCRRTTAHWAIVFPYIGGLVTDEGGMLSHPAILAREYGLPAVVGTSVATATIIDGQRITVDGATGKVEVHA